MTSLPFPRTREVTIYSTQGMLFQVDGREGPEKAAERLYAMMELSSKPEDGAFEGAPYMTSFIDTNKDVLPHPNVPGLLGYDDRQLLAACDREVRSTLYLLATASTMQWPLTEEPTLTTVTIDAGSYQPHLADQCTLREFVERNLPDAANRPALHAIPTGVMSCNLVHGSNLEQIEEMIWQEPGSEYSPALRFVEKALEEHRARMGTLLTPSR